ncbi:hypothetical protein ACYX8G_19920 [Microbacterium saperdae]
MTTRRMVEILISQAFPPEVVRPDAAQTLVAIGVVALLLAVAAGAVLAVVRAARLQLSSEWRWMLAGTWGACTLGSAVAATSTSQWAAAIAAAASLPLLLLLSSTTPVRVFLADAGIAANDRDTLTKTTPRSESVASDRKDHN